MTPQCSVSNKVTNKRLFRKYKMLLDKEIMGIRKICSKPTWKCCADQHAPVRSQTGTILPSNTSQDYLFPLIPVLFLFPNPGPPVWLMWQSRYPR